MYRARARARAYAAPRELFLRARTPVSLHSCSSRLFASSEPIAMPETKWRSVRVLTTLQNALHVRPAHHIDTAGAAAMEPNPIPPATHKAVPRFTLSQPGQAEAMLSFLAEEGFAVVASALTAEETARALDLTWTYLESGGTGIDRKKPSSWSDPQWPFGAIAGDAGIGHSQQLWYIRGCPGVKQAWATIYGTDDLITSFDGMSLFRPVCALSCSTSISPAASR